MEITWEDRKGFGRIDSQLIKDKPVLSFDYAWFLITDDTAQYVESHDPGVWNKDLSTDQRQEIVAYYNAKKNEPAPQATLDERLVELKRYRQQKEFGGFLYGGSMLGSDQEDQRKIDGAVLGAQLSPDAIINFKTKTGYVQIDASTMISIGKALFDHVQACHTREMELIEELEDDINTDITIGWPGEAK